MKARAQTALLGVFIAVGVGVSGCSGSTVTRVVPATSAQQTQTPEPLQAPTAQNPSVEAPPAQEVPAAPAAPQAPALTPAQKSAVRAAENYLDFQGFSRQGLIDQLSSEYGNQFDVNDATVAVDSMNVDWNAQAVRAAKSYLDLGGFSCQGLIDQLSSQYGSQFTVDEATYGAQQSGLC